MSLLLKASVFGICRWKEANTEYSKNIYGFKVIASQPEEYYRKVLIAEQVFAQKNYFWPIQTATLEKESESYSNLGW